MGCRPSLTRETMELSREKVFFTHQATGTLIHPGAFEPSDVQPSQQRRRKEVTKPKATGVWGTARSAPVARATASFPRAVWHRPARPPLVIPLAGRRVHAADPNMRIGGSRANHGKSTSTLIRRRGEVKRSSNASGAVPARRREGGINGSDSGTDVIRGHCCEGGVEGAIDPRSKYSRRDS